jgi:zinc transport system ATP-binding protein
MIKFDNVSVSFGNFTALKNVSFSIKKGDYLHIIGPNGSGKTTLIKLLVGLLSPTTGSINKSVFTMGYLPQKMHFNDRLPMTVCEVIYSGLKKQRLIPSKKQKELINKWLNKMEISYLMNHSILTLSGGQQQRVYIARALISSPDLIVLDEPTSALDPSFREKFYHLLDDFKKQTSATVINVTHDLTDAVDSEHLTMYIDQEIKFFGSYPRFKLFEHEGHNHA